MSKIKLKIVAENGADLRNQLLALLGDQGYTLVQQEQPVKLEAEQVLKVLEKTATGRVSKKVDKADPEKEKAKEALADLKEEKKDTESPFTEPVEETPEPVNTGEAKLSKDDVLKVMFDAGIPNREKVREKMGTYGVTAVSALPESKYGEFVAYIKSLPGYQAN